MSPDLTIFSSAVDKLRADYDKAHGVDTWEDVRRNKLSIPGDSKKYAEGYMPTPEKTFHSVLRQLDVDLRTYAFFDFGAGKGKSMLMAAEYPFRKIYGIEAALNVYRVGARNMQTFRSPAQRCFDLELLHGDAMDTGLPSGNTLFFFFAPFYGSVLEQVLSRIGRSIKTDPRDVLVSWIDEDVRYSWTGRVAQIIASWGTMMPVLVDLSQHDPEIDRPFVGTFWIHKNHASSMVNALEMDKAVAIAPRFVLQSESGTDVVIDTSSGRSILRVNETGKLIWSLFTQPRIPREIAQSISQELHLDYNYVLDQVVSFLEELRRRDILVEE